MMRTNSAIRFAVEFAWFCQKYGIKIPGDLGQMITHAKLASNAYARNDDKAYKRHTTEVEIIAHQNGLEVDWPGLWPCAQIKDKPETNRALPCDS